MPRHTIDKLTAPPPGYRADKAPPGKDGHPQFESLEDARAEDLTRLRLLKRSLTHNDLDQNERKQTAALIRRFENSHSSAKSPKTLASAVSARKARKKPTGWLHYLYDQERASSGGKAKPFTIMPRSWQVPSDKLLGTPPNPFLRQFRRHLHLPGRGMPEGWLFAGLHCAYLPDLDVFDFHLHGFAAGGLLDRIEALRSTRAFGPGAGTGTKSAIRIQHAKLDNPVTATGYSMQTWWGAVYPADDFSRGPGRHRIPGPHHTRMLLWLDRYNLKDITLRVGLDVRDGELLCRNTSYTNGPVG